MGLSGAHDGEDPLLAGDRDGHHELGPDLSIGHRPLRRRLHHLPSGLRSGARHALPSGR